MWPVVAFPDQITNGGHRIAPMLEQGPAWTVGQYMSGDEAPILRPI